VLHAQVDIVYGQKTGFFLDQRHNRAAVGRLCGGSSLGGQPPRMLNVFGYTGGFSVYAGRAGAGHVTTVDLAPRAVQFAEANWLLNGLKPNRHEAHVRA
jgi:23S rRNA (cytosine1962-C5)-methyltransferase